MITITANDLNILFDSHPKSLSCGEQLLLKGFKISLTRFICLYIYKKIFSNKFKWI
jgi:hypothetical protein